MQLSERGNQEEHKQANSSQKFQLKISTLTAGVSYPGCVKSVCLIIINKYIQNHFHCPKAKNQTDLRFVKRLGLQCKHHTAQCDLECLIITRPTGLFNICSRIGSSRAFNVYSFYTAFIKLHHDQQKTA